ncbi:hypothetical protein JCM10908_007016 [Rhodotorula pacifica]|uniref:uncharacterized protein n=1 Tax=Rhodotorula pacifica TaxID=1495444 RepID=UPI00316BCE6D
MLYAAQAQGPTAQLGALQCRLFSPTRSTLVVNKLDRIECSELQPDGVTLSLVSTVRIAGAIAAIEAVHLPNHETASLVVLTTSLRLFVLAAAATPSYTLETVSSISIEEPFGRLAEYQAILVDPETRCIAVHAYAGLVRIVSLVEVTGSRTSSSAGQRRGSRSLQAGSDDQDAIETDQASSTAAAAASYRPGPIDLEHNFTVRLSSLLNVACLAFLGGSAPLAATAAGSSSAAAPLDKSIRGLVPVLACIHTDHTGARILTSVGIDLAEKDVRTGPIEPQTLADQGSEVIIPVAPCSLLVIGESSITCVRVPSAGVAGEAAQVQGAGPGPGKGKRRASSSAGMPSPKSPARGVSRPLPVARITAWARLSVDEILLGDIYGKLLLVTLRRGSSSERAIVDLSVSDLGDATSPTAIVDLDITGTSARDQSPLVYVASRFGDSQLVRLDRSSSISAAVDLQLVASYPSLAPIIDCCLVENEAGGSSSLVTCSGAYKTGSLRIVRRGVGFSEMAALEVPDVQKLWNISAPNGDILLVLGSYAETRVLRIAVEQQSSTEALGADSEIEIEEVSIFPFADPAAASSTTVFAGALENLLVQARSDGVAYSSAGETSVRKWTPASGQKVTAAGSVGSPNGEKCLLVAVEGGQLEILKEVGGELVSNAAHQFAYDIASIAVGHVGQRTVVAVGLWTCQEVHLLALPSLEQFVTLTVDSTYLVCSLAIDAASTPTPSSAAQNGSPHAATTLLVGLGDGSMLAYDIDPHTSAIRPRSNKPIALGSKPLTFAGLGGDGRGVLAMSERPTIVTSGARLTYSSVNLTDAIAAVALETSGSGAEFCALLAIATSEGVAIGQLDAVRQIDIKTVPLDEDEPRRIAYDAKRRIFGAVCSRRDVDRSTGSQTIVSSVRIIRQDSYETTATYTLGEGEEAHSISAVTSGESTFFLVGVASQDAPSTEPQSGRLLVLQENADGDVLVAGETAVDGCPYAIIALGEGLVGTAVNSQVAVWSISPGGELTLSASWSGAFIPYTLACGPAPRTLIVGDALRSITLLEYVPPASAPMQAQLKELGKDYRARYMVTVETLSSVPDRDEQGLQRIIGAEADLNIFTLERDVQAGARNLADAGVLAAQGQWHVGEMISRFRRGALTQQHESSGLAAKGISSTYIQRQLVYTTSAGSVGIIAEVDAESGRALSALERNLRNVVDEVGGLDHENFRSYKSDKVVSPSAGFVDGSFVERFLDLSEGEQERVLAGRSEPEKLDVTREEAIALLEEMARTH